MTTSSIDASKCNHAFLLTHAFPLTPTDIMVDNQAAIYIGMNDTSGKKAKHINVRFQLVREKICDNTVTLKYIKTQDQLADILTKCLGKIIFTKLRSEILS